VAYPETYGACVVCGAAKGQACDTISEPGTTREVPHFYRAKTFDEGPQGAFVAVRDEPDYGEEPDRISKA